MLPPAWATRSSFNPLPVGVASGVGTGVGGCVALGDGVKVCDEVWDGIALAAGEIAAVGSAVGIADAQAVSKPDSRNIAIVLVFIVLTIQGLLFPIAEMWLQRCYSGCKVAFSIGAKGACRLGLFQL